MGESLVRADAVSAIMPPRDSSRGSSVRRPSSLVFWFIAVVLVAAATQGTRDLLSWRTWDRLWGGRWSAPWSQPAPIGAPFRGRARVVDGDSLDVAGEHVRLFGIDAPELAQWCRDVRGGDYACGRLAARALADLVAGKTVTCTPLDHDRYERDVARCSVDGRDLGETMVRAGNAVELSRYSRGAYTAAEREARAASRGVWAGTFEEPAEWRRRHPH
jgi:endonuclease YncB( thermonuclease family)